MVTRYARAAWVLLVVAVMVAFGPSQAWAVTGDITGGTMSASSTYGTAAASRSEDSNDGTEWMANGVYPSWLKVTFATAKTVGGYRITGLSSQLGRAPKTWTFEGSNDGTSWSVLDTQTNVTGWVAATPKTYTLASSASFTQYRVNISAGNDATYVNIAEFWVMDPVAAPTTTTTAPTTTATTETVTTTATATVTAVPSSVTATLDSNQFGVLALCGGLIVLGVITTTVVGFRR